MFPLQVIILMMVVLFYVTDDHRHAVLPAPPWMVLAMVIATHAFLIAVVEQTTRRAARRLGDVHASTTSVAAGLDRTLGLARWATIFLAAGQLWAGGWGTLVMAPPASTGGQSWGLEPLRPFLVPQAIFLAAPVLTWLCFWISQYRVEAAIRARAFPYRLALGLPTHAPPTRTQFVLLQARHNFYFFVPMGIAASIEAWAQRYEQASTALLSLTTVVSLLSMVLLLLLLPWIITRIWATAPLTGPLRRRLDATAGRHGIRFTDILIWKTHSSVNNAAILGYLPFARYFLMTDALLESLTDRQIEAVFAHEVGHAHHKHIWWYAGAILGALALAGGLTAFLAPLWPLLPASVAQHRGDFSSFIQLGLLAGFMVFGFSPISRRFEHQADWFAARHMAASLAAEPADAPLATVDGDATPDHAPPSPGSAVTFDSTRPLPFSTQVPAPSPAQTPPEPAAATSPPDLREGATAFSSALIQVVRISSRPLDRGGWMHPSPLRRAALLDALAVSPPLVRAFERRMVWTRLAILALFVGGLAMAVTGALFERSYVTPANRPAVPVLAAEELPR